MESSVEAPPPRITGSGWTQYLRCDFNNCLFYCRKYHIFRIHIEEMHYCHRCLVHFADLYNHSCSGQTGGGGATNVIQSSVFQPHFRAHKNAIQTFIHIFTEDEDFTEPPPEGDDRTENSLSLSKAFITYRPHIKDLLIQALNIFGNVKVSLKLTTVMVKEEYDASGVEEVETIAYFGNRKPIELHAEEHIEDVIAHLSGDIIQMIADFVALGSGWRLKSLTSLEVKIYEFTPFRNARGTGWLRMPFVRRGVTNFKANKECFKVCIVAGLHWDEMKTKLTKQEMLNPNHWKHLYDRYDFMDIGEDASAYKEIPKFEKRNKINIHVFTHKSQEVVKMRQSKTKYPRTVNLFLILDQITKEARHIFAPPPRPPRAHYALIRDLNVFLSKGRANKKYFCPYCLRGFNNERFKFKHVGKCKDPYESDDQTRFVLPKDSTLKFQRPEMTLFHPAICYFDWETFIVDKNEPRGTSTTVLNELEPAAFSMVLIMNRGDGPKVEKVFFYDGPELFKTFFATAFEWGQFVISYIRNTHNAVQATPEELERHRNVTHCELCEIKFPTKEDVERKRLTEKEAAARARVLHHDHITSRYLKSICCTCNLKIQFKHEMIMCSHNGARFDNKLIVRNLDSEFFSKRAVRIIAKSTEVFSQITITAKDHEIPALHNRNYPDEFQPNHKQDGKVRLRFIDSNMFLISSLAKLVDNLQAEKDMSKFNFIKQSFSYMIDDREPTDEDLQFLLRKWDFPYAYLTRRSIQPGSKLPNRTWYYNELTSKHINDEDWNFVQQVCERFHITTFPQLLKVYCSLDTILLACVFENYRETCKKCFQLDPAYTLSTPAFSWMCWLYHSKAEVEFIHDETMLSDLQKGLRGGFCFATQKIITANSERCPNGFDPRKGRRHILYVDINGLYAHTLLKKFPQSDYKYLEPEEIERINWADDSVGSNGIGYILVVDLEYCHNIHYKTRDLPFGPLKRLIRYEELSQQQKQNLDALGPTGRSFLSQPKLNLDQNDKKLYTIHYTTLRLYLQEGMKLTKVHRAFQFKESDYFRSYVEMNLKIRQQARDTQTSNLAKLNSNSLYGKSIENNLDHVEVVVCGSREQALEAISCGRLRDIQIINERLSLIYYAPRKIKRDKIIQTGFSVLEQAKGHFYQSYYHDLVPMFNGRGTLCYADTDSCVMLIQDPDNTYLEDLYRGRHCLDFSKLESDNDLLQKYPELINYNRQKSGVWKIETMNVLSGIFLKPKMYSLLLFGDIHYFTMKGFNLEARKAVTHQKYKDTIVKGGVTKLPVIGFRSFDHKIYTLETLKIAFHNLDISRCYAKNNDYNYSLPFYNHKLYGCTCDGEAEIDSDETMYDSDYV